MREQLIQYVNLLFAGAADCEDVKQEILQNTLDRFDDLVSQGKSPEAAYRLAISGIGDINEILGQEPPTGQQAETITCAEPIAQADPDEKERKLRRAAAIAFYICCPVPLFILGDTLGLCLLLIMVAAATALMVMSANHKGETEEELPNDNRSPQARNRIRTVKTVTGFMSVAIFLVISFLTGAWYITWLVFPLFGCVNGLIIACIDLKEAK